MVEDLAGEHQLVRTRRVDDRLQPAADRLRRSDDGDAGHPLDLRPLDGGPEALHALDRRPEQPASPPDQPDERLLERGEEATPLLVGPPPEPIYPRHHP